MNELSFENVSSIINGPVCKSGTLFRTSNYQAPFFLKFEIPATGIVSWWRKGKIGPEKAIAEIINWTSAGGRRAVDDITWIEGKGVELLKGYQERFGLRQSLQ